MKTAHEWFNLLKPEVRDKAIANANKGNGIEFNYMSISKALKGTFVWGMTPEGHDYWSDVNDNIEKYIIFDFKNNLPPKKEFTEFHMWRAFLFGQNIKAIQDVHGLNKSESDHFDFFISTIKKEEENGK